MSYIRMKKDGLLADFSSITRADQLLVLTIPIIIAFVIGIIHAMTNSVTTIDRLKDFLLVGQLGVACGVFLALPWFCLPFILPNVKSNGGEKGGEKVSGTIIGPKKVSGTIIDTERAERAGQSENAETSR